MHVQLKRAKMLVLAAGLVLAACKGSSGDTGPQGNPGNPGVSVGSITGTIQDSGGLAFTGATVKTAPLGLSALSGADGSFTIANVPLGTYSVSIEATGIATVTVSNVVVVANTATPIGTQKLAFSPIVITPATMPVPAGFGVAVPLSATVTGATGPLTYAWSVVSGPTAGAFSDAAAAAPTFTTATLEAMIAGGKLRNLGDRADSAPPARNGLLVFTAQHVTNSTYTIKVQVSDGHYTQSKNFTVVPAVVSAGQLTGGIAFVPRNVQVLANTGAVDAAGWTLVKPSGSSAVLNDAASKNPWFVPDVAGTYSLSNGATLVATVRASNWKGSMLDSGSASCGTNSCHTAGGATDLLVRAKFKDWSNSAHGNHFFKFFEYDAQGNLVVKGNPTAASVVVPTATAGVTWTLNAPFRPITTFEFGITGGEGNHYSESCMRCHTVGMNKAVANNGIDDVAGYVFPNLGGADALPAPDTTRWDALAQAVKDRAGMQCESCHGPLDTHGNINNAPKAFFDSGTCGVCHDSGSNHNRFNLWAQSGHANLTLAEEEGTSTNCGRCHSAQGFVEWSRSGFDRATNLAATLPAADIQPQTCIACHDPHTTGLRVDESKPITTTSGFTVSGAGAGQLCVICHSSRRGLHNDAAPANTSYSLPHAAAQSDLFFGQNVYFFGALNDGATISTHAFVLEGTCAGCHMDKGLASEALNMVPSATNHSFRVSADVCAKCHASSFSALKENTESGIAGLKSAIAAAARRSFPSAAGFKATLPSPAGQTCNLRATFTAIARPTTLALGMPPAAGHGAGFTATWNADVTYTILAADNTTVDCDPNTTGTQPIAADIGPVTITANTAQAIVLDAKLSLLDGTTAIVPASGDVFKAWWNMALIEDEGSFGAHNPTFAGRVLAVSAAKATAVPTAP